MIDFWVSLRRFATTGIGATGIHAGVFFTVLHLTAIRPAPATVIAFLCALAFSYLVHHRWTFGVHGGHRSRFPRFTLIALSGAALNYVIMSIATGPFGLAPALALLLVIGIVAPLTFIASRYWGFR